MSSTPLRARPDAFSTPQAAGAQSSGAPRAETSNDAREARPQRLENAESQSALGKTTGALANTADALKAEPAAPATVAAPAPAPPQSPSAPAARAAVGASTPAEARAAAPAAPVPPGRGAAGGTGSPADAKDSASGSTLFRSVAPLQGRIGWTTVVAPDRVAQWRFDGSQVQRSADRGVSWTTVDRIPPAQVRAGSAPSSSVCWLVGEGGLVLLTTDGSSWNRMAFSAAVDLGSVVATDARTALVTAVDGRQFQTTDGGQTWTPR